MRKVVHFSNKKCGFWTDKKVKEGISLMKQGLTHNEIAKYLGVTYLSWSLALHRYNKKKPEKERAYFSYVPEEIAPAYTDYLKLRGDFILAGDFHCPYQDIEMCKKMIQVAEEEKIDQLLIGGDFLDERDLYIIPDQSNVQKAWLNQQLAYANDFMGVLSRHFRKIYLISGDHDQRLIKRIDYRINLSTMVKMFTNLQEKDKLVVSDYFYCIINDCWRISHADRATQRPTTKPLKLVDKYLMNVIVFHGHNFGIEAHPSQKFLAVSIGAMTNIEKHYYAMRRDVSYPQWRVQFAILKDNKLRVIDK